MTGISQSIEIGKENLFAPQALGDVSVIYADREFAVVHNGESHKIDFNNLSKEMQAMTPSKLKKALGPCYITLKKVGNAYTAALKCRGKGGGPISGAIAYWLTKTTCYAGIAGAATGAVAVTGGAIAAGAGALTAGGAAAGAAGAGVTAAGASAATVGGATAGVGAAAGGAFTAGAAAGASIVATEGAAVVGAGTALAVAEAGGVTAAVGATVATVESASIAVGAFFTAIPFLP